MYTKLYKRDYFKRKAIKTNKEEDWLLFKSSKNAANIALRHSKKEYYTKKFSNNKQNPKKAWRTINDVLGRNRKHTMINEIKIPGKTVTSTDELVEVFNDYFSNIGPRLAESVPNDNDVSFRQFVAQQPNDNFSFRPVSVTLVYNLLVKLSTSKATGLDNIAAKVLKMAAPVVAPSLTEFFNMSIDTQQFPSDWKTAKVIPLFKRGQRSLLNNYRPISILPVVSKLMERTLYDQIYEYFDQQNLFSKHQFGFRPYHSTTTTLLDCTNEWYANMDRGLYNLVVFLDLKKAFDTVKHRILLSKLEMYGFNSNAINLLSRYLSHRTQICQLTNVYSGEGEVICGIPQGSILGPLLFLIYINDLPNCLECTTPRMFADDTNLTAVGETLDEVRERADVDMGNVQKWLRANKLSLNIGKTECVLIGSKTKHADSQLQLESDNEIVKKVKNTKVLGVQLDENLNWEKHIDYISSTISSGIGAIKRLREVVDQSTLVKVYNALVQRYFDYCSEVWDCFNKGLSDRLQKLQNRAARIIMGLKNEHGQSTIALKSLGWMTLEERRAQLKAKLMFKIVNGLALQRLCDIFKNVDEIHNYNLRGSSTKLYIPKPKTEFFKNSFGYSGAKQWNQIPEEIRNSGSLKSFCNELSSSTSILVST